MKFITHNRFETKASVGSTSKTIQPSNLLYIKHFIPDQRNRIWLSSFKFFKINNFLRRPEGLREMGSLPKFMSNTMQSFAIARVQRTPLI